MSNALQRKKILQLVEIFNSTRKPVKTNKRVAGKIPYYGANNVQDYVDGFTHDGEYILIAEDGSTSLSNYSIQYVSGKFWANNHVHIISGRVGISHTKYLYYNFKNVNFEPYITGSAQPKLNKENLLSVITFVHALSEQKKIASVLSALDSKIELNNRINAELEALAKTIYDYWFVQFDFPDKNGKPYKSSGGKMVWNEELKREIPEGWEVKKISDLLPVITGKKDANFASINGKYNFFTCGEEILKCDQYEFEGKAVLVAGNGNFNIKLYEGRFNAYQRTYVLIPDDEKYYTVVYMAVRDRITSLTKGSRGSIVKFITKGDLEDIQITLPTDKYLDLFTQLGNITKMIENNVEENQKLAELRDWLLPMLMNGQVKVT